MKKKLIIIVIFCLIILFLKNFIIRQFFISKIEYVDYDEYIMTHYLNGKKIKITYVGPDIMAIREYDDNENLLDYVVVYDYDKNMTYQYMLGNKSNNKQGVEEERIINLSNYHLIQLIKENWYFKYKGIKTINNRNCYCLYIKVGTTRITTYLDKELLYVVRSEEYYLNSKEMKNIVYDYELDLELKNKDLFLDYIK